MLLFSALLLGCGTTHRPTCDTTVREVDDDEDLGGLDTTVAALVEAVVSPVTVELRDMDRATHTTEVSAARGEGAATFTDGTPGESVTSHFGFGDDYLAIYVSCDDSVTFPMDLDVVSDDGAVDVQGPATADFVSYGPGNAPLTVYRELDRSVDVLPAPNATGKSAAIEVQYQDGELQSVSGWWETVEDYEQSVEWP